MSEERSTVYEVYLRRMGLGDVHVFQSKIWDFVVLGVVVLVYGFLGNWMLGCVNKGSRFKIWYGKFEQRRYSTVMLTLLTFMVPFVSNCVMEFYSRNVN